MLKILLPVDGSISATRATSALIETIGWYKEPPHIDLVTVHLPIPAYSSVGAVVSKETIDRYYADECDAMLAPSIAILDAAGIKYTQHQLTGSIAESIVQQAKASGSNMIYMGTRGMTALSNMILGSVTTRVLHLAHVPVVLVR